MTDHTQTPWAQVHGFPEYITVEADKDKKVGAHVDIVQHREIFARQIAWLGPDERHGITSDEGKANAAFVVRAANSHDALVEALEAVKHLAKIHRAPDYVAKISPTRRNAATVVVLLGLVDAKIVPLLAQHGSAE